MRLKGYLDNVNTRLSVRGGTAPPSTAIPVRAAALLPSLSDLVGPIQPKKSLPNPTTPTPSDHHTVANSAYIPALLPKMSLPTFDGQIASFIPWWDAFCALVDQVPSISEVQKMTILYSCLTGKAKDAASGYPISNASYPIVKNVLQTRFGNPRYLLRELHSQLNRLPRANDDLHSARDTFEQVERILRLLESQNQDLNHEQLMLEVESKLPDFLLENVYEMKLLFKDTWSMSMLREVVSVNFAFGKRLPKLLGHKKDPVRPIIIDAA